MIFHARIGTFVAAILLSGCAIPPAVYPEYKGPPTVAVSSGTVSTMTETPAMDYLIPDSQVFIGRDAKPTMYGLLGVAIERSKSKEAVGEHIDALRISFKDTLESSLRRAAAASQTPEGRISVVDGDAELMMIPAARLVAQPGSLASLSFRVTVRFKDAASGEQGRKEYWHLEAVRPLSGEGSWAENGAALLKSAAETAMDRVARVFAEDVGGRYRDRLDPAKLQRAYWKTLWADHVSTVILLGEEPDYLVAAPLLQSDRANPGMIFIAPRDIIRIH